ncbi:MAG: fibronectin type III domain-containing protein [Desulfobacter sp.]|nr:MAG: fibronectin type III domain-containing protein [Desulfobacter sp.]
MKSFIIGLISLFLIPYLAMAESMISWAPSSGVVDGYKLFYGTEYDNYSSELDVGLSTQYPMSQLPLKETTTYYFVVKAYNSTGMSEASNVISWTSGDMTPPLPPLNLNFDQSTLKMSWTPNVEMDFAEYRLYYGTQSRTYGSYKSLGNVSNYTLDGLGTNIYVALTALDTSGNESGYSEEIFYGVEQTQPSDLLISNLSVATGKSYNVSTGLDNGTTSYIDRSYTYSNVPDILKNSNYIQPANNDKNEKQDTFLSFSVSKSAIVYIAFDSRATTPPTWLKNYTDTGMEIVSADVPMKIYSKETAIGDVVLGGNEVGFNMYTVIVSEAESVSLPDNEAPTISIQMPTTETTYETKSDKITISGVASDNTEISEVTWSNSSGDSGIASGTLNWEVSDIQLAEGENVITITAHDGAGNKLDKILKVTYTPPDLYPPAVSIQSPTSDTSYETKSDKITISGVASDNKEVSEVTWSNSSGDSGIASGTLNWEVSDIQLAEGENIITITASDGAGNLETATINIIYSFTEQEEGDYINSLSVGSGKDYEILSGLDNGSFSYIDRTYKYTNVPEELKNAYYIKVANNDKYEKSNSFLSFSVNKDVVVYIAFDSRAKVLPSWLGEYTDTGMELVTADVPMKLYSKKVAVGDVVLGGNEVGYNMYTVIIVEQSVDLSISSLTADSGKAYRIVSGLDNGSTSYIDRDYIYKNVPEIYKNAFFIQPANNDKYISGSSFLQFSVNKSVVVSVAFDSRANNIPSWLTDFVDTGYELVTADVPMKLYSKEFISGQIVLGGNEVGYNMYTVIITEK